MPPLFGLVTPIIFPQGDTKCTLQGYVDGELVDVARAEIVQPLEPLFHGNPMDPNFFRVKVAHALPGHESFDPPQQPLEVDGQLLLAQTKGHLMLWPKSQIRLGEGTPQTTPLGLMSVPDATRPKPSILGNRRGNDDIPGPSAAAAPEGTSNNLEDQSLGSAYERLSPLEQTYNTHDCDTYMHDAQEKVPCQKSLFNS